MTPLRILELRHAEPESPGSYTDSLVRHGGITTVRVWQEPLPADPAAFDAIVVMGGGMGVNDADTIAWIGDEIGFLRRAVEAEVPIWGVCLGSQLLAAALGAEVTTGPVGEVGVCQVTWNEAGRADPVWTGLSPTTFPVMQWHFDTFALPDGATLLASSDRYPHQVFRHGNSYGVQFHLEVDTPLLDAWLAVPHYRTELENALGVDGPDRVSADIARVQTTTAAMATTAMTRWLARAAH